MTTPTFAIITLLASGLSILFADSARALDVSYVLVHTGIVGIIIHLIDVIVRPES